VIPFRYAALSFFLTIKEKHALVAVIDECKEVIEENFKPAGYLIGFNVGKAAGQTVMHCQCHVIPRDVGDVPDARSGVRGS
jgi:diadenosine tetraphosphate (Ap4A) HIT family hydrolase